MLNYREVFDKKKICENTSILLSLLERVIYSLRIPLWEPLMYATYPVFLLIPDKLPRMEWESKTWFVYLTALSSDSLWTRPLSLTDCWIMETKDSCCSCLPRVKLTNSCGSLGNDGKYHLTTLIPCRRQLCQPWYNNPGDKCMLQVWNVRHW